MATASKLAKPPSCKYEINIYKSMTCIPDIKLIRTDTTLDLSQKAEKNTLQRPALERLNTNPRRRQACGRWPAHISTSLRGPAPKRPRGLYARAVVTCYSRSQVRTGSLSLNCELWRLGDTSTCERRLGVTRGTYQQYTLFRSVEATGTCRVLTRSSNSRRADRSSGVPEAGAPKRFSMLPFR